jgi:hypothetical protein
MANTISNFLVGIGLDTTDFDRGAQNVDSGLDGIRSSALQLAALAAGAFGANQLINGFANANDELGKFSQTFSVLPNDVAALGRALQHEGGSLESFMAQLAGIEQLRASTPQQLAGLFSSAGIVGLDPSVILDAENATEAYKALAGVFDDLSGQQRLQAANVFGLDEASIRLLSRGTEGVEKLIASEKEMRPVTEAMIKESYRYVDSLQDLSTNIGGVADQISVKLLPGISSTVEGMNNWIGANREFISSGIDTVLDPMAEHITEIAIAGGLLASGGLLTGLATMARYVPIIGGALATAATAGASIVALGTAGYAGYQVGNVISENLDDDTNSNIGRVLNRTLAFFGNENAQQALVNEASVGGITSGYNPNSTAFQALLFPELDQVQRTYKQQQQQSAPQKLPAVNVSLVLDGSVIDKRVVDLNEKANETAINDLTSTMED